MKINDVVLKDGKKVKIIAITADNKFVCRYLDDIEGLHPNRCYVYEDHQLCKANEKLLAIYDLSILISNKVIATIPYTAYPSSEVIMAQIKNYGGTDASVKKRFKLLHG